MMHKWHHKHKDTYIYNKYINRWYFVMFLSNLSFYVSCIKNFFVL
jgi:hypothetical protein